MIITRTLACLSLISGLLAAGQTHAEMGLYAGMGAGITSFEDDDFVETTTNGEESGWDDTGTAYRFVAGYKFSDNFSIEWTYQDYDYNEYNVEGLSDLDLQGWHVSGIAAYPMYHSPLGRLDIFGKLGFGESELTYRQAQYGQFGEEHTSESFLLGGGVQFYVSESVRIKTELDATWFNLDANYGVPGSTDTYVSEDFSFLVYTASASLVYFFDFNEE